MQFSYSTATLTFWIFIDQSDQIQLIYYLGIQTKNRVFLVVQDTSNAEYIERYAVPLEP